MNYPGQDEAGQTIRLIREGVKMAIRAKAPKSISRRGFLQTSTMRPLVQKFPQGSRWRNLVMAMC
jgi:hypothetical protein